MCDRLPNTIKKWGGKVKMKTNNEKMIAKSHTDTSSNKDNDNDTIKQLFLYLTSNSCKRFGSRNWYKQ